MSQENLEIARRAFAAWNRDDLNAFLAEIDLKIVWHTAIEGGAEGEDTVFRDHDEVRQVWNNNRGEVFDRIEAWTDELRDLGDSVLRHGRLRVTGRAAAPTLTLWVGTHGSRGNGGPRSNSRCDGRKGID